MKLLSTLALFLISTILFISCQKELNWDLSAQSSGSLKADSVTNDCLPVVVQGTYIVDSALGNTNYIDVQVDVTSLGIYEIKSDTINGISFYDIGTFGTLGINTVRLMGTGMPTSSGITTLIISYTNNNSTCVVDVEILPAINNPNAAYTLGGTGATCTGFSLAGSYMESVPLTGGNTVSVDVTVTSGGVYTLSTPVVNGVSFAATGSLTISNTGVTLIGTGTPTAAGTYNYLLSGGGTSCTFSVTFDPMSPPAVYTLGGAPSGCTGFSLLGNYDVGVAMNSSNTATIDVNVTGLGSYSISSTAVNGVTFNATGVFTTTGPQQVTLYASGTPSASGSFDNNVSNGSQSCVLSVTYTGAATDFITCDMNGVFTTFNIGASAGLSNSAGFPILSIDGNSFAVGTDPTINIQIGNINGGSINPSTYDVNQIAIGFLVSCDFFDASSINYTMASDPINQNQNPGFTVTITSMSGSRCVGTFSGTLKDAGGNPIVITNGIFNVPF